MKRSTLLSTAAVLALSSTLALAEGAQREQRQDQSNAPTAQQQAPSRSQQNNEPMNQGGTRPLQQPGSSQASQAQSQQQPSSGNNAANQPSQQQPANQNAQQQPSQPQTNQRAQQPAQQQNQNAQREPAQNNQPAQNNAETNQQPAQRSTQSPTTSQQQGAQAPQSGQARQSAQAPTITTQQRTRISSTIRQQNVSPVRVNSALNVGVAVPSSVRLSPLPDTIVSIVPQYRGYNYFVTDERIVIVEPSSHHVVEVLPYEGGGRAAAAPARSERNAQFSREQRESIRKHAVQKRTATVGSGSTRRIIVDEEVPAAVELDEFPETVVREVPSVRTYRYYRQDDDVVVVDPGSRRVIDVID